MKPSFILLLLLLSGSVKGGDWHSGLRAGYNYSNVQSLEFGYQYFKGWGTHVPEGLMGPFITIGKSLNNKNTFVIPKVGFEYDNGIYGARVSLVSFTDFRSYKVVALPEIGLGLAGLMTVFVGYNFSIGKKDIYEPKGLNVSINIIAPASWIFIKKSKK